MILNILIFKNKKIDTFTQPQFTDVEPEKAAIQLSRSLLINEDEAIDKRYQDLDMYFLGTFDDNSGDIVLDGESPRLLLDCTLVLKSKKKKVEVISDGKVGESA